MAYNKNESEILQTIADLVARTAGGSSIFGSNMGKSRQENTDGTSANPQELLNQSRANDKTLKNLDKTVKQLIKDGINSSELEKMPNEIKKGLSKVNSRYSKAMSDNIANLGDVMDTKKQLSARRELIATLKGFDKDQKVSKAELEDIAEKANAAGVSFGRLINPIKKTVTGIDELERETNELTVAFNKAVDNTTKHSRALEIGSTIVARHSASMKQAFNLYVDELRIARERGVYDAKYLDAVKGLGISMKEYSIILGDNRDIQQAMANGGRNFSAELEDGKNVMQRFSRDNLQAATTTATLMRSISGFGVKQKDLTGALAEQTKMYEDNYFIYGVTAEAFAKSTEALVVDTDIRANLAVMAEKERKQYILGIQAQESQRLAMGYTTEQARELTKMFAALGGESPKERMKKAAKQRALMGALGMGSEGAELQKLMMNINQLQGAERIDAEARMTELTSQMSNALKGKYSQGLGTEMFFRSMADRAGVTDIVNKLETETLKGKTKNEASAKAKAEERKIPEVLNKMLGAVDTINSALNTSVGLLWKILAAIIGGAIFNKFGRKMLKGVAGKIGGGGGAVKLASTAVKGATGLGLAGKAAGMASSIMPKGAASAASAAVKGGGKIAGKAAGMASSIMPKGAASAASAAVKGGGKIAGKTLGKAALKSGIKKIPIIGALAGIGFGISRAMDGDYLGAALEVASGLASVLPGIGTAASVAIDAGLAVRDITTDSGRSAGDKKPVEETVEEVTKKKVTKQIEKDDKLISILVEVKEYLKQVNTQNTKMAEAQIRLADTNQEMNRVNGMTAPRP